MQPNDTICAISTAPGNGAIAIIRLSGPATFDILQTLWKGKPLNEMPTHTAHLGTILDPEGNPLDQAVITVFRGPRSFTGEDTAEISVHGSTYIQRELLNNLCKAGSRLAEPGEFTRRAFASGRLDLSQAEAVADIIAARSRASHRLALTQLSGNVSNRIEQLRQQLIDLASLLELELDFSEEEVEFASRERLRQLASELTSQIETLERSFSLGNAIKEGIPVAITGPTNAGKSSLLNRILDDERAIVSDIHGTTRDTIEETREIGKYLFRFIDTAGLRRTDDAIEQIGIQRSHDAINRSAITVYLNDINQPLDEENLADIPPTSKLIIALNKTDLPAGEQAELTATQASQIASTRPSTQLIRISAKSGDSVQQLLDLLTETIDREFQQSQADVIITNARQAQALRHAAHSAQRILDSLDAQLPPELTAQDVRETIHHLSTITGQITTADLLQTIFSRFCIGK